MAISAFEERRTLKWGDFLLELEDRFNNLNQFNKINRTPSDRKTEKAELNILIKKGDACQEQLNEEWLDYGYMTYKQYISQMNRYITLQDMIIDEINTFIDNCFNYYKGI